MDTISIDTLKEYDRNPRQISDSEFQSLCENLIQYGFLDPLVVDQDNVVLGGNQRLRAAKHLISQGYKDFNEVPIYRIETTDDQQRVRINLLLNNHHGSYDLDSLASLLDDFQIDLGDLDGLGFDGGVLDDLTPLDCIDYTSTDREGQGVGSTWQQMKSTAKIKFQIGDIETSIDENIGNPIIDRIKEIHKTGKIISDAVIEVLCSIR